MAVLDIPLLLENEFGVELDAQELLAANAMRTAGSLMNFIAVKTNSPTSVRSPANADGYLGDPEATANVSQPGAALTGDLGHQDAVGDVFVLGRERVMAVSPVPTPSPIWKWRLAIRVAGLLNCPWHCRFATTRALRHPRLIPRYVAVTSRILYGLGFSQPAAHIRWLFGASPTPPVDTIRRLTVANIQRNILVERTAQHHGVRALTALTRCHGGQQLLDLHAQKRGALLVFPHLGPRFAIDAGLCLLGLPALLVTQRQRDPSLPAHVEMWRPSDSPAHSALFLKRAVAYLRTGGLVIIAIDGHQGQGATNCEVMGRVMQFHHGAAVLHQLTGVPVIPITSQWSADRDTLMDLVIHAPLPIGWKPGLNRAEHTRQLLSAAAHWMENHIRERPGEVREIFRYFPNRRRARRKPDADGRERLEGEI